MGLGTLILLGLVVGEVVALAKISRQSKRIRKLEEETGIEKKKK
jgi:hypothetical protein